MATRKTSRIQELTEDELSKINKENTKLTNEFINYARVTGLSPATIKIYRSNLNIFMNWLREFADNKDFADLDENDILNFQGWCMDNEMSSARIRNLRATISSTSKFIITTKKRTNPKFKDFINVVDMIPAPAHVPVRKKTILSEEDVENLLSMLVEKNKIGHACMVAVLIGSGMRRAEVIQLKADWFRKETANIQGPYYVTEEIRTKGKGVKGTPLKKLVIRALVDDYLDLWFEERKRKNIDSEYLFPRYDYDKKEWIPMLTSTVDSWINTCSRMFGKVLYPHVFRHYTSTWLRRNGVEIDKIRDFHGHKSSETTELYIDIDRSENLQNMLDFMEDD